MGPQQIQLGACAPSLKKQLDGYNIPLHDVKAAQRLADAVTLLYLQNCLSEVEMRAARRRVVQFIKERIQPDPESRESSDF